MKPARTKAANAAALIVIAGALAGCLGDPTYGTGRTQSAHLIDDLGNVATLPSQKIAKEDYEPRAGLVQPPKGQATTLPRPQEDIASKDDPNWPRSPEDVRAQMQAEVAAESDTKHLKLGQTQRTYGQAPSNVDRTAQTRQFRQAVALEQGAYTQRRTLTDPPDDLRRPAASAPTNQLGESELKKDRERKAAAERAKKGGSSWWPF
ncbi:hypothetical protein [Pararhizobium mangrovi]|uniref:Lipoprotein n=1 Tax=Pararhizobium mangrovi TaxID=2590452 RepID=A0A506TX28_9HYPH|nr:hypothetical protein [Pararhizobium mangrovi]TPW26592.1 hypothetical protein FJU11_14115 [Pararhizobium mangrovi]